MYTRIDILDDNLENNYQYNRACTKSGVVNFIFASSVFSLLVHEFGLSWIVKKLRDIDENNMKWYLIITQIISISQTAVIVAFIINYRNNQIQSNSES